MTPWVRTLLLANVVMFLLSASFPWVAPTLAFIPVLVLLRPWTVITYMFIHASISHLFFNMLALYFFGSRVEMRLGGQRFLSLYFISGLMGAIASFIFTPHAAVVGASGAIFGVMLGYARYWPRDLVYIWGVFPVQARWLVFGMTALSLFGGFGAGDAGVAHFAHLGGFLGGLLYLIWVDRHSPAAQFKARAAASVPAGSSADIERWKRIRPEGMHPLNREELERLLLKIAAGQAPSLTPEERAYLDRMSLQ